MKCSSATVISENGKTYLALEVPEREMLDWLRANEERIPFDIEISVKRKKRSLDANSYMWILADRIAAEIGITKEEVYREHIRNVGVFEDIAVAEAGTDTLIKNFEANGVGWIAEILPCKLKGCNKVRFYYGSSTYDSKEMSRLIDSLIEDAKSLGIETLPPDELERMTALCDMK